MPVYKAYPFEQNKFSDAIIKIEHANSNVDTEPHYNQIATSLLLKNHGFQAVNVGPRVSEMKGVPFDLLAARDDEKILVEVKGAKKSWSRPGKTQFARMKLLLDALSKRDIDIDLYLIQMNLSSDEYRLWDTPGVKSLLASVDTSNGLKTPIEPVVEWVAREL